jgi:hypothetical protein
MHLYQYCDKTDHISNEFYHNGTVCYTLAFNRPGSREEGKGVTHKRPKYPNVSAFVLGKKRITNWTNAMYVLIYSTKAWAPRRNEMQFYVFSSGELEEVVG